MKITIKHNTCTLQGDFPKDEIDQALSFPVPNAHYTSLFQKNLWDGKRHLLTRNSFPTGLLHAVQRLLPNCELEDSRTYPSLQQIPLELNGIELRNYQIEAIQKGLEHKRGVFWMALGSGKTEVAIGLTQQLQLPTLFLTHRKELLYQTAQRFEKRLGCEIGMIGEGIWKPDEITVAMVPTLHKARTQTTELLKGIDVLHIDECHHVAADSFYKLVQRCEAPYRFGYSGTPLSRSDGADMMLIGATGRVIYRLPNEYLVEHGLAAKPFIHFIPIQNRVQGSEYRNVYQKGIVENSLRNQKIVDITKELIRKELATLILVQAVKHGHILRDLLKKNHIPSKYIHGSLAGYSRQKVIEEFQSGECQVLISSVILDEGVDIPEIDALILAGGGKSTIKTLQRVGRGMRMNEQGKLLVYDFMDRQHYFLHRHSKLRLKDYESDPAFEIMGT